jgi:hypothetical protein
VSHRVRWGEIIKSAGVTIDNLIRDKIAREPQNRIIGAVPPMEGDQAIRLG